MLYLTENQCDNLPQLEYNNGDYMAKHNQKDWRALYDSGKSNG